MKEEACLLETECHEQWDAEYPHGLLQAQGGAIPGLDGGRNRTLEGEDDVSSGFQIPVLPRSTRRQSWDVTGGGKVESP